MKHLSTIIFIAGLLIQISLQAQQDNSRELSLQQVFDIVLKHHPVAKQADIGIEKAEADILIARGLFDPAIQNKAAQKTFDGTRYYQYNRPELTVPTWFGIELAAGLSYLGGDRTNPVDTRGETSFAGISVPLVKDLLMDKRRAALKTAKLLSTASEIERRNILNQLLLDAAKAYWDWTQQYQQYTIITETVKVNESRLAWIRTAYQFGDRPAIDTTEALVQLQNFQVQQQQAWLEFQNRGLDLSVFFWTANEQPYQMPGDVQPAAEQRQLHPDMMNLPELGNLLQASRNRHPELLLYENKLDILEVEKRLKFQELLPTVNFQYNQLGKGYDVLKTATGPVFQENFQYGLTMGIPLRLSEGRGSYRKAKLKIREAGLQQQQKQWEIETKVRSYFNELLQLKEQVRIQEMAYRNYVTLQRGEETKFRGGESSLFLVNARESKTLEALLKLQELKIKYFKADVMLLWAAGQLVP